MPEAEPALIGMSVSVPGKREYARVHNLLEVC
jgi:hypothetical protein